jgi:hypothetical protein
VPFGFPSGPKLRQDIISRLSSSGDPIRPILRELGHENEAIDSFLNRLRISGVNTIDEFLEHNMEHAELGRACIAFCLIECEQESKLFDTSAEATNWYRLLANAMSSPARNLRENRVSFITFNYDRSLEHFLFSTIKSRYNLPNERAAEIVNSLAIRHMYGKLGRLSWEQERAQEIRSDYVRDYDPRTSKETVAGCIATLRIVYDEGISRAPFRDIQLSLGSYERIDFIGFGYDKLNLARLGYVADHRSEFGVSFGSAYGLSQSELSRIQASYRIILDKKQYAAIDYVRNVAELT